MTDTTAIACIRSWKLARLNPGTIRGYPTTNILHPTHGLGTPAESIVRQQQSEADAVMVQRIVDGMEPDLRVIFEAYHLGVIGEAKHPRMKHRDRAKLLGVSWGMWQRRKNRANNYVEEKINETLDIPEPDKGQSGRM